MALHQTYTKLTPFAHQSTQNYVDLRGREFLQKPLEPLKYKGKVEFRRFLLIALFL